MPGVGVAQALGLPGRTGEEPDPAPGVAHPHHLLVPAHGRRARVRRVGRLAPGAQAGPLDDAVRRGPLQVPHQVDVPDRPGHGRRPDHDLQLGRVGLDVLAVRAPVQVEDRTAVSQTSPLSHKLSVAVLHLQISRIYKGTILAWQNKNEMEWVENRGEQSLISALLIFPGPLLV